MSECKFDCPRYGKDPIGDRCPVQDFSNFIKAEKAALEFCESVYAGRRNAGRLRLDRPHGQSDKSKLRMPIYARPVDQSI